MSGNSKDLPHPDVDWRAFTARIQELNASVPLVFDPMTNAMKPWVNIKQLNKTYKSTQSPSSGACSMM
jgi:hypothetical protein